MTDANLLNTISGLSERYGITSIRPQIESCRNLLKQSDLIDVGVFGRFKAGKSSFLNSLAGKTILPVGVTPVTAVITRLRYGPSEKVTAHFLDGTSSAVGLSELAGFVSEDQNPDNRKNVATVEVEVPELKAFEGLQFVDTPGLGSVFKHNTAAALDWLPNVGVALVAIGVDPPLSEQDLTLIRELQRFTPKITILLTKADLVSENDRTQIETFVRREIKREFAHDLELHFYSIQPSHLPLKATLESELLKPLMARRSETHTQILQHKLDQLVKQTKDYLTVALKAAVQVESDRHSLKARVLDEKTAFNSMREEIQLLVRDALGRTRPEIMKQLGKFRAQLEADLKAKLQGKMKEWQVNLWRFNRNYDDWVREAFHREISLLSVQEKARFMVLVAKAQERLARQMRAFQDRLSENMNAALGVTVSRPEFVFEVTEPRSPDISIGSAFDFKFDLLWFFVPMVIFRGWTEKHFLGLIPYEVEKNLSRLASQWTEKINASIVDLGTQAEKYVRAELESIESLLSKSQSQLDEISTAIRSLA